MSEEMYIKKADLAEAIEAPTPDLYDNPKEFRDDLIGRLNYLISQLEEAQEVIDGGGGEVVYAIGDTLNLLELIKEKI